MIPYTKKLDAATYHADREFAGPTLSASTAATLTRQSPLHAWLHHPRLGGIPKDATAEMDRGTLIHAVVFGQGMPVEIIDAANYRAKAAQEKRDAAREAGKVPLLMREYDGLLAEGVEIRCEIEAALRLTLDPAAAETAIFWQETFEPQLHGERIMGEAVTIQCRGMMDHHWMNQSACVILDLKTCQSAHPRAIQSHVMQYGYDIQAAAYTSAVEKLRPDLAGRIDFVWAFAEILPPGSPRRAVVTVARPSGEMMELGRRKWERACRTWAACLASDTWPGPADSAVVLEPPAWAMAEEESFQ